MESPLPQVMETSESDFSQKQPKDRLVDLLDQIEAHVEQLRKDASKLEEERDTLLTTLDTLRNNEVLCELIDSKFSISNFTVHSDNPLLANWNYQNFLSFSYAVTSQIILPIIIFK